MERTRKREIIEDTIEKVPWGKMVKMQYSKTKGKAQKGIRKE